VIDAFSLVISSFSLVIDAFSADFRREMIPFSCRRCGKAEIADVFLKKFSAFLIRLEKPYLRKIVKIRNIRVIGVLQKSRNRFVGSHWRFTIFGLMGMPS